MDSVLVELAIALVFILFLLALLVSACTEAVARFLGLRARQLLLGLRALVDGSEDAPPVFTAALVDSGLLASLGMRSMFPSVTSPVRAPLPTSEGKVQLDTPELAATRARLDELAAPIGNRAVKRKGIASYLSSRQFAAAVMGFLTTNAPEGTAGQEQFDKVEAAVARLPDGALKASLLDLLTVSERSFSGFVTRVEQWYDDHMDRVSGWYKRSVRWITLAFAALVVIVLNVNIVRVADALYSDGALRAQVAALATDVAETACVPEEGAAVSPECARTIKDNLDRLSAGGLPIFWQTPPECVGEARCGFWERVGFLSQRGGWERDLLYVAGAVATVLLLLPGGRFWFDMVKRLGSLRSTGPVPPRS